MPSVVVVWPAVVVVWPAVVAAAVVVIGAPVVVVGATVVVGSWAAASVNPDYKYKKSDVTYVSWIDKFNNNFHQQRNPQ